MSSRSFKKPLETEETHLNIMPHDDPNDQSAPQPQPVTHQSSRSDNVSDNDSCLKSCLVLIGCCLLVLIWRCLLAICTITLIVVAILISLPIYLAAVPVLILSFLVTRALQLFWHGHEYDRAVQLKAFIRWVMFLYTSWLAIFLGISYGIAKLIPGFKRAVILETPLEDWINLLFVIYGIYMLHCVLSVCTFMFVPKIPLDRYQSGFNAPENVLEIIGCLIILLAVSQVEKRVPVFKADKIHGLCTRKWVEVTILVFLAYNVIVLLTRLIIAYSQVSVTETRKLYGRRLFGTVNGIMHKIMGIRYIKYCAVGMKQSIDFILSSIVFLLTWELYFRSHLEETPQAKRVLEVGTMSCVALLVCAILWFIKTYLLVMWEVREVYNRLEEKIVKGARQLYFIGNLGHSGKHYIFKYEQGRYMKVFPSLFPVWDNQKDSAAKWNIVRGDLVMEEGTSPSFYGLQQMAYYFLQARETLKDDRYTHRVIEGLKESLNALRPQDSDSENSKVTKDELNELTKDLLPTQEKQQQKQQQQQEQAHNKDGERHNYREEFSDERITENGETQEKKEGFDEHGKIDYWEGFHEQMSEYVDSSSAESREDGEGYKLEQIEDWLEMARNNCLVLANTLSSTKELVRCLDNIISWLVIAATFILWLLLTGYATMQVLILFGTPLFAASFIFGDTCKTMFQGIIFVYVVRPFHVGDFCTIDEYMLRVSTIGIWITTFSKCGTSDEVIYPNSELFTKTITSHNVHVHKDTFVWTDHIEFKLPTALVKTDPIDLKKSIEEYFKRSETYSVEKVVVPTAENGVPNIAVDYKGNSTYSLSPKEKQILKSQLQYALKKHIQIIHS